MVLKKPLKCGQWDEGAGGDESKRKRRQKFGETARSRSWMKRWISRALRIIVLKAVQPKLSEL
jgi:hypothetical protein